jgi:hypothetical protein
LFSLTIPLTKIIDSRLILAQLLKFSSQDKEREFVEFERDMKKKLKASEKKANELEQKLEPWRDRAKKD